MLSLKTVGLAEFMLKSLAGARTAIIAAPLLALILCAPAEAQEIPGCGSLQNAYGPFDYRDPTARTDKLPIVERFHFTPGVASLTKGETGQVIDDLDYTLRAFPNHHRALISLSRFALGGGKFRSENIPSADCFFQRAILFAPDDEIVRILFGNYLFKRGTLEDAKTQYETALRLAPESPEISYNAGLFYLQINDLDTATKLANVAYQSGYPLPGLKLKLEAARTKQANTRPKPVLHR